LWPVILVAAQVRLLEFGVDAAFMSLLLHE
jgi:hypothetical protein